MCCFCRDRDLAGRRNNVYGQQTVYCNSQIKGPSLGKKYWTGLFKRRQKICIKLSWAFLLSTLCRKLCWRYAILNNIRNVRINKNKGKGMKHCFVMKLFIFCLLSTGFLIWLVWETTFRFPLNNERMKTVQWQKPKPKMKKKSFVVFFCFPSFGQTTLQFQGIVCSSLRHFFVLKLFFTNVTCRKLWAGLKTKQMEDRIKIIMRMETNDKRQKRRNLREPNLEEMWKSFPNSKLLKAFSKDFPLIKSSLWSYFFSRIFFVALSN